MKILMSAESCGPGQGSEAGIGWNWAMETARLGHDVQLITTTEFKPLIEAELAAGRVPERLAIDMYMPDWLASLWHRGNGTRFQSSTHFWVNLLWQLLLPSYVRRRYGGAATFDLVHHVTIGTIRHPTRLGRLGRPLVLGPIGGGESAPPALRKGLGVLARVIERLRDLHTWSLRFDPISQAAYRDAALIIARTNETARALPAACFGKTVCHVGIGIHQSGPAGIATLRPNETMRLIFAGRLLPWKGVHLALDAVAVARAQGLDIRLTIVGDGPYRAPLRRRAAELGLNGIVDWPGSIPRADLLVLYADHHALLFPSLHDSGGMAVLEGMSQGLPVICLGLGGPAELVDASCGRVIQDLRDKNSTVSALAASIAEIARSSTLHARLSIGALGRAQDYAWPTTVKYIYARIEEALAEKNTLPSSRGHVTSSAQKSMHTRSAVPFMSVTLRRRS